MAGYYVYVHIFPNNKQYIGITKVKPISRWRYDGSGYINSPYVYNAIQKYGWDNIKHIILMENLSKEVACECEKYLIAKYHTNERDYGYNVCSGGEGTNGYHHTEEYKNNLRRRHISREQKEAISNTLKKRWSEGYFANTGRNWRENPPWNKGLTKDDPRIAKYARKPGEFHHTEETKRKIGLAGRGRKPPNIKMVRCVETGVVYNSICEAQTITGINNISIAANNKERTAGKYHWEFVNDNI